LRQVKRKRRVLGHPQANNIPCEANSPLGSIQSNICFFSIIAHVFNIWRDPGSPPICGSGRFVGNGEISGRRPELPTAVP
jgi:hypothetical protein